MSGPGDPIESTPLKRRKLNDSAAYDSQDDSGEDFTVEDFETVATIPLKRKLHYDARRMRQELAGQAPSQLSAAPGQTAYITQATQPLEPKSTQQSMTQSLSPTPSTTAAHVQVERSSPVATDSPPRASVIQRAPFAKPSRIMAPPGTVFRAPLGVQAKPAVINVDSDDDLPAGSDGETQTQTQGLGSNIRPTQFRKGGRGLDSSPNRVQESPNNSSASQMPSSFSQLVSGFYHSSNNSSDDLAGAYANTSRPPRPQSRPPAAPKNPSNAVQYTSLEDIPDYRLRSNVKRMRVVLPNTSIQQCYDVLVMKKNHYEDALDWLMAEVDSTAQDGTKDDLDNDQSPIKGVARSTSQHHAAASSQPVRPAAKQQVKAPARTIFEKYGTSHKSTVIELDDNDDDDDDDDDDEVLPALPATKPRRRLQQGRKPGSNVSSPPPPPPPPSHESQRQPRPKVPVVVIDDDDDEDSDAGGRETHEPARVGKADVQKYRDAKLLKFFNECTHDDLAELCARPAEWIAYLLEQRPFTDLDEVQTVSMPTTTKAGKRGKAKAIGESIFDDCSGMFTGYDAVDELVVQCEQLAEPVQKALRRWGVGDTGGELQLMSLDEAHDSGIGTPSSSSSPSEPTLDSAKRKNKKKSDFLSQPRNMSSEFTLKDYQLVGLNWLSLLFSKGLSCILADDMGLGKTYQVIAFLSHLKLQKVDGVHLVIVPGSTLENWLREFARFSPDLVVRPYYGHQAERFELRDVLSEEFGEIDVIVTTYQMVTPKEDNKFFRQLGPFSVCVYDEAHVLRNPKSDQYRQLTRIGADFKVLLTGTPLQNNLQELIAILAFIMPDLFEEKRENLEYIFKHKAKTNDTSHAALLSAERIARARTMITPFILRRKKEQVLDLPKKTGRIEHCTMEDGQAEHYAGVLHAAQTFYTDKANGAKAGAKAGANVIMSLRKAAIHPLLSRALYTDKKLDRMVTLLTKAGELGGGADHIRKYLLGEHHQNKHSGDFFLHGLCLTYPCISKFALQNDEWMDAAKVQTFVKLITQFVENGDRTLVFSQFTMVMDILEAVMETIKVKFMRLDGSTNIDIRQDMIDKFTDDTSIPVFMLSTRAGGAGINLACANKVIIFDSGFNPQDDIQAENRAHRVGQTRAVEVVRLITRGTIEEQIHALGASKLAMGEGVAGEGASDAERKQAEKAGEDLVVERMFAPATAAATKEEEPVVAPGAAAASSGRAPDLKDAFKMGMEGAGVQIASKQARF